MAGIAQHCHSLFKPMKYIFFPELLEQMVIGSLLRLEMRSVMKNQLDQMRRSVFPIDSKKLLPEGRFILG